MSGASIEAKGVAAALLAEGEPLAAALIEDGAVVTYAELDGAYGGARTSSICRRARSSCWRPRTRSRS